MNGFAALPAIDYLVGDLSRFNDGKAAEERDRVKHVSFNRAEWGQK